MSTNQPISQYIWTETLAYLKMWLPSELFTLIQTASLEQNSPADFTLITPADLEISSQLTLYITQAIRLAISTETEYNPEITLTYKKTNISSIRVSHSLRFFSAWQILTTNWPKPIFAVGDLLPAGLTLLAGRQKIGKSWLALQLTRHLVLGEPIFGRQVEPGNFLYIALEDNQHRLRSRMEKQGWPTE